MLIDSFATFISLIGAGQSVYDWVTGNRAIDKLTRIESDLKIIKNNIFFVDRQEVFDKSLRAQIVVTNSVAVASGLEDVQKCLKSDVIFSKTIVTPERLRRALVENPERILFDIRPLDSIECLRRYEDDNTLIPLVFSKWEHEFIGFIKTGYASDYLDFQFRPYGSPVVGSIRSSIATRSRNSRLAASPQDARGSRDAKIGAKSAGAKMKSYNIMGLRGTAVHWTYLVMWIIWIILFVIAILSSI